MFIYLFILFYSFIYWLDKRKSNNIKLMRTVNVKLQKK